MQPSFAMLLKTHVEKMSHFRLLAMLMKTIELKSLSRDVDGKNELSANRQERKLGTCGDLRLTFYPAAASPPRRCRRQGTLGRHRSGFGPRTARECSLTFHLTKPSLMGIVDRQACVRDEKALPMPSLQQSGLLSLLELPLQQNVASEDWPRKKDVNLCRSKPGCV